MKSDLLCNQWRRQWHPTPVLLPGKSHGRRSLVGCGSWGCEFAFTFRFHVLEKEMATHSCSCLENPRDGGAWRAAQSSLWGCIESDTTEATQQHAINNDLTLIVFYENRWLQEKLHVSMENYNPLLWVFRYQSRFLSLSYFSSFCKLDPAVACILSVVNTSNFSPTLLT